MSDYQYPAALPVTTTGGWARPGWWDILADAEKEGRVGPAGRLEAYCEYAMDAWDIAAGQLILQEAGGTLTTLSGAAHTTAERADVAASNGRVHPELLAVLKDLA